MVAVYLGGFLYVLCFCSVPVLRESLRPPPYWEAHLSVNSFRVVDGDIFYNIVCGQE